MGIVAALVSGIVFFAGLAAVAFLIAEDSPFRAGAALLLTLIFSFGIALLVPRTNVTLYDDGTPALTISQQSVFGGASYLVSTPNGATLAVIRKSAFSRLGRNRWAILIDRRVHGEAVEESFGRAIIRKLLGKFSRAFEADIRILHGGVEAGRIIRRRNPRGEVDVLELTSDAIDRRVAVALATLVLGGEP